MKANKTGKCKNRKQLNYGTFAASSNSSRMNGQQIPGDRSLRQAMRSTIANKQQRVTRGAIKNNGEISRTKRRSTLTNFRLASMKTQTKKHSLPVPGYASLPPASIEPILTPLLSSFNERRTCSSALAQFGFTLSGDVNQITIQPNQAGDQLPFLAVVRRQY